MADTFSTLIVTSADADTARAIAAAFGPGGTASPGAAYGLAARATISVNPTAPATLAAPITTVLACQIVFATDTISLRTNANSYFSSSADLGPGSFGNYPLYIGRRGGSSFPFSGRLYSLIVRGAQSNSTQIENAENYINSKTKAY